MFRKLHRSVIDIDPIVRGYIVSESLLWSAWTLVIPIFAIFVVQHIPGGSIELAATSYSIHLVVRVLAELLTGKYLQGTKDNEKFIVSILGIVLVSVAYLGFAFAQTISAVFLFYGIAGLGLGIASPAKNSLFSIHLDKNKEAVEWGISDGASFICMAFAASVGGFVAQHYGFSTLFVIANIINLVSLLPYFIFSRA